MFKVIFGASRFYRCMELNATTSPIAAQEELRFQVSLLRLVYQGSLDGGQRVVPTISSQIAQIEQLLQK